MKSKQLKQRRMKKAKELGQYWLFLRLDLRRKSDSPHGLAKQHDLECDLLVKGTKMFQQKSLFHQTGVWISSRGMFVFKVSKCYRYKWVLSFWVWKHHYLCIKHSERLGYLEFTKVPFTNEFISGTSSCRY